MIQLPLPKPALGYLQPHPSVMILLARYVHVHSNILETLSRLASTPDDPIGHGSDKVV
jgi:hypothetical protein